MPFLLLTIPVGALLDRHDRRVLIIAAQVMRATVMLGTAAAVAADRASVLLLLVTAFVVGSGEVVADAGMPALVRRLVPAEGLELANGRLASSQIVANALIGPALGGLLFAWSPSVPFIVDGVGFVVAGLALATVPGPFRPEVTAAVNLGDGGRPSTAGLRRVWRDGVLRRLAVAVAAFVAIGAATNATFVILATERFGLGEVGFGLLLSVEAAAGLVVSLFVHRIVTRWRYRGSMTAAVVALTAALLAYGSTTVVAVAVVASAALGSSNPLWNVPSQTIRQRIVPDEVFGRVVSAYLLVAFSTQTVGAVAGGFLAEALGVEWLFVLAGAAMIPVYVFLARPLFVAIEERLPAGRPARPGGDGTLT